MGRHIVKRNDRGFLEMEQVDERLPPAPEVDRAQARTNSTEPPSPAFSELVDQIYERNIVWAKARIARLDDEREIAKIRTMEVANPKVAGGRPAVLQAIDERAIDRAMAEEMDSAGV